MSRRSFLVGAAALGVAACSSSSREADLFHTVHYGPDRHQVGDLWLPKAPATDPVGVVVLLHGDFWEPGSSRSLLTPLARAVSQRGWAAWNVDYRPLGEGGGWPASYVDVATAVDHLTAMAGAHRLDLARVAVLGHAVGGTFALWSAARARLPSRAPGADPKVHPVLAVSVAGVNDLAAGAYEDLGYRAVVRFMGVEPIDPDGVYSAASPSDMLPIGVPQLIVYGTADAIIPQSQSTAYAAKAKKAGDTVTLLEVRGADHFGLVDPAQDAWARISPRLARALDH